MCDLLALAPGIAAGGPPCPAMPAGSFIGGSHDQPSPQSRSRLWRSTTGRRRRSAAGGADCRASWYGKAVWIGA